MLGQMMHEMAEEKWELILALTQRRRLNRESAQPIIKILAQFLFGKGPLDVGAGCGQNSNVDLNCGAAAWPEKLFVLQNLQQFALDAGWHLGNFVQQNCAFFTQFEFARLGSYGTRGITALVTEKFGFEQIAGQRKSWSLKEEELRQLMNKADQGAGGAVVNVLAYKADHVAASEELKVLEATARSKNCDLPENWHSNSSVR